MSTEARATIEGGLVALEVRDRAWVKFNRPEKRNCMSPALNQQMMRVLDEFEPGIRPYDQSKQG